MSEDFALLNNNVNSDSMLRIGSSFKVDDSYNSRGTYTEQQKSKAESRRHWRKHKCK